MVRKFLAFSLKRFFHTCISSLFKPIILDVECIVCNKSLHKISHDPREVSRKMGKIVNRRSRTPNWSVEEKQFLLELIRERKAVITRGNNGSSHYEEKDLAWNEILHELAMRYGNKFEGSSMKKVKTQWQNMKRIAREEITLNGPDVKKYTKQSLQVCFILDLVKDGVVQGDVLHNKLNETAATNVTGIEIKAERIEEDVNQPSCSNTYSMETDADQLVNQTVDLGQTADLGQTGELGQTGMQHFDSCSFSSDPPEYEPHDEVVKVQTKDVSSNTDLSFEEPLFMREFQEFARFSTLEKKIKLESVQEERQVMRAMRETAELNKIIAEQRLKHVLWIKRTEAA